MLNFYNEQQTGIRFFLIMLIIIQLLININTFVQWPKKVGSTEPDEVRSIAVESRDNVYVLGIIERTAYNKPFDYTFLVKSSNDDSVYNEVGNSISLSITPPFWESWWFRISGLLIISFILFIARRNKLIAVNKHHLEQEKFARQLIRAEEQERQRIAHGLHDSLGQSLLVIKNNLLEKQRQSQIEGKSLEEISELISNTIQEVRTISQNLRPHLLDQLGLTKTLRSLARQVKESSGIDIHFKIDDLTDALPPDAEINFFRIVQEALNNIVKHSGAEKAKLIIKHSNDSINLLIKDYGKGMELEVISKNEEFESGFGLSGLQKRAHVFDWKYEINSKLNFGTEIKIDIPIRKV